MTLELNDAVLPYKEFYGRNVDQMPALVADKRVPLSVAGLMERRLNSGKAVWKNNYFDCGDAIAYHPDGGVKIVLDAKPLREMTASSKLKNGALIPVWVYTP
ncbi:MAG: hypothetical protein AABX66_03460 [Nanoarchaeota archaeon]